MAIADLPPTLQDKVYSAGVTVSFMPRPSSLSSSSILLLLPSANVKVADNFVCGDGIDTIKDFNPDEGDTKTADCENF
jgi:hypothetical protein